MILDKPLVLCACVFHLCISVLVDCLFDYLLVFGDESHAHGGDIVFGTCVIDFQPSVLHLKRMQGKDKTLKH